MGDGAQALPPEQHGASSATAIAVDAAASRAGHNLLVRLGALSTLGLVVATVAWVGHAAWRATTDSFVAPLSLSPDSAAVLEHKLRLTELELERARAMAEVEGAAAELSNAESEIAELDGLKQTVAAAKPWTKNLHTEDAMTGAAELANIARREAVLQRLIANQRKTTELAQQNLAAGIITQDEYQREEQKLGELTLSALETARARVESESQLRKVRLGQRSLAGERGAPPMPEVVAREDLTVRLELQRLRLEAAQRARQAQREALLFRVQKIDELVAQLKRRPLYKATETQLDVAFVPYTQLAGVSVGAQVLRCSLVIFNCRVVGSISDVIPGEVVQPDPWGATERGQYAVLSLTDRGALQSKTLRVRPVRAGGR